MFSNFCTYCYETFEQAFSCGHIICINCYISNYKSKIQAFLSLCESLKISEINNFNLKTHCLDCDLSHPFPGEYLLSELPEDQINLIKPYKNLLILKLDGISCTVKLSDSNQLEVYIQDVFIFKTNTEDVD